ncbi:hypothetical protein [Methylophaga thalassica]|uniref:hypothetical protein n=1 Tax=Methylophaga TaxID=40222 RepID=UPI002E7C40D4|nr:hypothetical protein [Methylophaga thalassica]WVI86429.1 hypothetical protein VSX76_07365 [Methylophaga thalassica]
MPTLSSQTSMDIEQAKKLAALLAKQFQAQSLLVTNSEFELPPTLDDIETLDSVSSLAVTGLTEVVGCSTDEAQHTVLKHLEEEFLHHAK